MTPQQIRAEINRSNAQHSTGPRTQSGKQRSSLNALRHGLTGQLIVMPTEDLDLYQHHVKSFNDEYRPQNPTEQHLIQFLADTAWRLNRVAALETNILTLTAAHQPDPIDGALAIAAALESQTKALANLSLHTQRLSRQFEKTVEQIRDLQKSRHCQQKAELDDVLDIMEMYESKGGEPYRHQEDGFVFSESQIHAAIQARNREHLIAEAHEHQATL